MNYSNKANDGIEISFFDENGKNWTSNGDQSGSTFEVTQIVDDSIFEIAYVFFYATFNCTLYDDTGNSLELLNGSCKTTFDNI